MFREGAAKFRAIVQVPTLIRVIRFYIVTSNTLFLMCVQDMTTLNCKFDNLRNVMIKVRKDGSEQAFPTIMKFGHPFLLLDHVEQA